MNQQNKRKDIETRITLRVITRFNINQYYFNFLIMSVLRTEGVVLTSLPAYRRQVYRITASLPA
jgi:hypothetical protein